MGDEESLSSASTFVATALAGPRSEPSETDAVTNIKLGKIQGHQKLAAFMAEYPAGAIFRQFGSLNSLNLLYYQAELSILEVQLEKVAENDRHNADQFRRMYFNTYQYLSRGKTEAGNLSSDENLQWTLIVRIRQVLKEYNEAIIAQSNIRQLPRPTQGSREYLKEWMSNDGNGEHVHLGGPDQSLWWDTPLRDLVALYAREYEDFISTWITEKALFWYDIAIGHRRQREKHHGTWLASTSVYSRKPVLRFVTFLAIVVASLVPVVSVVVLNAIQGTNLRLGLMSLFTVIFCALFGLFTGARKTELLAASAAFAALQVVFISGNDCPSAP